jgi:hypothetical protein
VLAGVFFMSDKIFRQIQPIPTVFKGVLYRSKLEARWAVFLNYCEGIESYEYEPCTLELDPEGWTYVPDFRVNFPDGHFLLEVKPAYPSPEYLARFNVFRERYQGGKLYLGFGTWFTVPPRLLISKDDRWRIRDVEYLKYAGGQNILLAMKVAQTWRFDLTTNS